MEKINAEMVTEGFQGEYIHRREGDIWKESAGMDSTELTYSTAALRECIHKGHVGARELSPGCWNENKQIFLFFFGGGKVGDTEIRGVTHQSQQILRGQ